LGIRYLVREKGTGAEHLDGLIFGNYFARGFDSEIIGRKPGAEHRSVEMFAQEGLPQLVLAVESGLLQGLICLGMCVNDGKCADES
jgi:hypothetical protein